MPIDFVGSLWNDPSIIADFDFDYDNRFFLFVTMITAMIVCLGWLLSLSLSTTTAEAFDKPFFLRKLNPWKRLVRTDSFSSSSASTRDSFWKELSPPFLGGIMGSQDDDDEEEDMVMYPNPHLEAPDVTHFCFLIHGHRGLSADLRYMQSVMQRLAAMEKLRQSESGSESESESESEPNQEKKDENDRPLLHDMVVHNAICNEHKTTDGVRNGGDRLVEEMLQVIQDEMDKRYPDPSDGQIHDITISVLGNSLGGLFGRYAIAKLVERHCVLSEEDNDQDHYWVLMGKYRLHLNIFCTTATPHLGISRHTYFRIPRTAEIGVAHAMGDTGKDLFRLNDLLHTMATSPTFLGPLSRFRKRIAYANAYGTDFPVPVGTAAFLSENSSYPHHFKEAEDVLVGEESQEDKDLRIATLHTPNMHKINADEAKEGGDDDQEEDAATDADKDDVSDHADELHRMSISLDQLGWKKVFIDIRREMPSVEIPKSIRNIRRNSDSSVVVDSHNTDTDKDLTLLKTKKVVSSRDVATAVSSSATDNRLYYPMGHNMIVAFSRSRRSSLINKGGRPIVDALAKELVEDIFKWNKKQKEQ